MNQIKIFAAVYPVHSFI